MLLKRFRYEMTRSTTKYTIKIINYMFVYTISKLPKTYHITNTVADQDVWSHISCLTPSKQKHIIRLTGKE